MLVIPQLKLGYQDSPKIASTSLFDYLHMTLYGCEYEGHLKNNKKVNAIHGFFRYGLCVDVVQVENVMSSVQMYDSFYRFTITRDPVKRFISMYSNRVVHFRELSELSKPASRLIDCGLPFDPQINDLVDNLDAYMQCQQSIFHHARLQMDFLGPDLSVFNRIADITAVGEVVNEIRAFWVREGMVEICERAPLEPGRKQTGGPKLGLNVLSPDSFERLIEYYRKDYENLPTVSLQAIKDEYIKARCIGEAEPVVFPSLPKGNANKRVEKPSAGQPVKVKKEECPLTELVRINLPEDMEAARPFLLKGVVVLKGLSRDGWKLVADDGSGVREMEWGLPSPWLAERIHGNPDASMARFRLAGVKLNGDNPIQIWLESFDKQRQLLATISVGS
jgi:hypothetical protein